MEPGLKGLQKLIYKGRLEELNLCRLAKQQLMGEGWRTDCRRPRGDAAGPGCVPAMLPPARVPATLSPAHVPALQRVARGAPRSCAGLGTPAAAGQGRRAKPGSPGTVQTRASPGAPPCLPPRPPRPCAPGAEGTPPAAQLLCQGPEHPQQPGPPGRRTRG